MNTDYIREELKQKINQEVIIKVFGMRNKTSTYEGRINAIYPNIFTISSNGNEKSFTYADVITGDISIKFK